MIGQKQFLKQAIALDATFAFALCEPGNRS